MPIFSLDILGIHIAPTWYGLMYALGFTAGYLIIRSRKVLSETELDSLLLYVFAGVILGGRLGYVLFYDLPHYLAHPIDIVKTWSGGMSFHGGAIGVIAAMGLYAWKYKNTLKIPLEKGGGEEWAGGLELAKTKNAIKDDERTSNPPIPLSQGGTKEIFLTIADQITSILPIGLGLGRIGNYINGELLGFAPYSGPLAVMKDGASHFPSTLLESILEWVVLFFILSFIMRRQRFPGQVAMHFLVWYGAFRFVIEFFRLPDPQIGYLAGGWLTMWQILSFPMIVMGVLLLANEAKKYRHPDSVERDSGSSI